MEPLLLLLLLLLLPRAAGGELEAKCPLNLKQDQTSDLNYYSPGDHILSSLLLTTGASFTTTHLRFFTPPYVFAIPLRMTKFWHILSVMFSVHEINRNPQLLPNVTLGYNIYETLSNERMTYDAMIDLISTEWKNIPNYHCGGQSDPLAVLEGATSDISSYISNILSIYKIPQVSYESDEQITEEDAQLPIFYLKKTQKEAYFLGVVRLLLHFKWTWIGLIAPETYDGVKFTRSMEHLMTSSGICVVFTRNVKGDTIFFIDMILAADSIVSSLRRTAVNVLVLYGDFNFLLFCTYFKRNIDSTLNSIPGIVWITMSLQIISAHPDMHRSLSVIEAGKWRKDDTLFGRMQQFGEEAYDCSYSKYVRSAKGRQRCAEKDKTETPPQDVLETVLNYEGHNIYVAFQAVAGALHSAYTSRNSRLAEGGGVRLGRHRMQAWQCSTPGKRVASVP
ncbi:vomeronasal type-2 receptor 26-like [Paroedura picta]|uniref:vomeronasal type-2 receptor 26-like n=1 Tax=Paroedura picta TaxID=143630 RepID=UPI004057AB56